MKIDHYRFIHILWRSQKIFSPRIINMIIDPENGFDIEDHLFITIHRELYDQYHEKCKNLVYVEGYDFKKGAKLINDCASKCDWLVVHCMCLPDQFIKVKKENLNKIVWRTWGGDAGYTYTDGKIVKNIIKFVINKMLAKRYKMIHNIGISETTDVVDIKSKFGDVDLVVLPYSNASKALDVISTIRQQAKNHYSEVRIMLGHSGYEIENHISILKRLYAYKDENIRIFLNLTYGNKTYIKKVVCYAQQLFGDKITIISDFMPFEDYLKFIFTIDIGIFDARSSNGLGNIFLFKAFEKKIYLNRKGVISKAFDIDIVPFKYSSEIGKESFEEFKTPLTYPDGFLNNLAERQSYKKGINNWKELFNSLIID